MHRGGKPPGYNLFTPRRSLIGLSEFISGAFLRPVFCSEDADLAAGMMTSLTAGRAAPTAAAARIAQPRNISSRCSGFGGARVLAASPAQGARRSGRCRAAQLQVRTPGLPTPQGPLAVMLACSSSCARCPAGRQSTGRRVGGRASGWGRRAGGAGERAGAKLEGSAGRLLQQTALPYCAGSCL